MSCGPLSIWNTATLFEEARRIAVMEERRDRLIHEGLRALIERESARRVARLGGRDARLRPDSATLPSRRDLDRYLHYKIDHLAAVKHPCAVLGE